jgi:hypothetical protein
MRRLLKDIASGGHRGSSRASGAPTCTTLELATHEALPLVSSAYSSIVISRARQPR